MCFCLLHRTTDGQGIIKLGRWAITVNGFIDIKNMGIKLNKMEPIATWDSRVLQLIKDMGFNPDDIYSFEIHFHANDTVNIEVGMRITKDQLEKVNGFVKNFKLVEVE